MALSCAVYTFTGQECFFVIFVVRRLHLCGPGVLFLIVILLLVIYRRAAGSFVFLFVILPFVVYTHASQGFTFSL